MILAAAEGYDKGCIRDNGVTESSILSARGYKTGGEKYEPRIGGGQTGEWQGTGYRSNGDAFLIDVSGKTYVTPFYGLDVNDIKRCRICAKPKIAEKGKFKLKPNVGSMYSNGNPSGYDQSNRVYIDAHDEGVDFVDNCLCTKILGVDGITVDDLNDNPNLNHINIREAPTQITSTLYCTEYMDRFGLSKCEDGFEGYCSNNGDNIACDDANTPNKSASDYTNLKAISNYSCTDKFYYDADGDDTYDGASEDIVYNNPDLKYISLDHWKRDGTKKKPKFQNTCYYDAGIGSYIGLFGVDGQDKPSVTHGLYSEFYLKDSDSYRYRSPNNEIFSNHKSGEAIKLKYEDGYYDDNYGYYRINFIDGVMTKNFGGILSNIVQEVENLYVGDGYLKESFKRIVGNSIFQFLVKFTLIFYLSFYAIGIVTGTVEISRKEFFGIVLKIALILFFTNPDSWGWYNDIVVGFFMGSITTLSDLTLNLDFITKDPLITIAEDKFGSSSGHAQKFAFPDQMIKTFFMSENIFIKLWSLLFSPFNLAGIFIIAGIYALMFYFVYIMAIFALNYLTAITIIITLLAIGPIIFLFSINKFTIVVFNRWLVYMSSRIMEITMLFLLLYVFLSAINDKLGLYQSLNPDSLLYFESCPYSLYDLMSWSADVTHLSDVDDVINKYTSNPISEGVRWLAKELFSFFRVYVANPTNGIEGTDGNFVGGKDFFEMMSIVMETFILLYFMNMVMSQIGLMAAAIISYQQQNASVFSGARGVAGEGMRILSLVQENALSAIKFATDEVGNVRSFVSRSASNVMKFSLEHDKFSRIASNKLGYADNYASGYLSSKLPSPKSNFYDAKAGRIARSHINAFEGNIKNIRSGIISKMGLEDKISKESIEKIKNNKIDKNTLNELENVGVDYKKLHDQFEMAKKALELDKEKLRSKVVGKILDKSDIAIREVNKYLAKQEIIHELNLLKKEREFLTAPEAYEILSDKLSSKYDDINFSESLREVLNKNLTDREILENSNKVQARIIDDLISDKKDFNINDNKKYNQLQQELKENKEYKSLQYKIQEHLSYNQNINRSVRYFAETDKNIDSKGGKMIPKVIKNKPEAAISVAAASVVTGVAVPLIASVAVVVAAKKAFNIRYLVPRAMYKPVKYKVNQTHSKNISFRVHRSPSNNMMFDAINNALYSVTFSSKYELYHLANSEENKKLRLNRKDAEKQKLFLKEPSEAYKNKLAGIVGKETIDEITIEDIQRKQEKIKKKMGLRESMPMIFRGKKLYQAEDSGADNYVEPLSSKSITISADKNIDENEKINRLKVNLNNISLSKEALIKAQAKIIEKIKLEKGPNVDDEKIKKEISKNYPNVKLLQKEYDKARARLEDTLYKYSMNKDDVMNLLTKYDKEEIKRLNSELEQYNKLKADEQELQQLQELQDEIFISGNLDIDEVIKDNPKIEALEKDISDNKSASKLNVKELESRKESLTKKMEQWEKKLTDADIK